MLSKLNMNNIMAIACLLLMTQCSHQAIRSGPGVESVMRRYEVYTSDDIRRSIEAGIRLRDTGKPPSELASMHLELAVLYSHHNNAEPDYEKALSELAEYIAAEPEKGREVVIVNWQHLLKEVVRLESSSEDSSEKMDSLKKEVARLRKQNTDLSEKLDLLKNLDIELEEKKRLSR